MPQKRVVVGGDFGRKILVVKCEERLKILACHGCLETKNKAMLLAQCFSRDYRGGDYRDHYPTLAHAVRSPTTPSSRDHYRPAHHSRLCAARSTWPPTCRHEARSLSTLSVW